MSQKAVILKSIGKKYPVMKAPHKGVYLEDFWALKDIDLDIDTGQTMGIIGRNGAGKTTLLNVIAGVLSPTKGELSINGRVVGLFNIGVGFQDELSGKENIFLNAAILGADRREIEAKSDSIIEFSELGNFINMPLGSYSQGMRLRLGFSIIANLDFDVLVIDEVLAVGDALFQNKCFERLIDLKRRGKTLIITTQGMELIDRLCDKAILLDHGSLLFNGEALEAITRYRNLLSTEKFFVGLPQQGKANLVENTKKWADNISDWGKKFGGKEVVIETVEFINKFGFRRNEVKSRDPLKIKVTFNVRDKVYNPHFGIAIFRNDGVYCYGPNTGYDGYNIHELKPGKGHFTLEYRSLLLAPGEYRVSVAVWDKNEKIAYDYHNAFYKLIVKGYENIRKELLNIPYIIRPSNSEDLKSKTFVTNQPLTIKIDGSLELYRDDGILCQCIKAPVRHKNKYYAYFPKMPLLPGKYFAKNGLGDYPFNFIFNKQDHGTVYMDHKWNIKIGGRKT
jgi:ABC-type polysaccharide/polyol phosphate transport system ATPase subunit